MAVAVLCTATAHAAQYKMVACAGDSGVPGYTTATNTISTSNPGGIFEFHNGCGGAGGDPPGDAAFLRINENQSAGSAGQGAYGQMIFATPSYVHFKSAGGYTRQPNAFNEGWRARFWVVDFAGNATQLLIQGYGLPNSGTQWASSNIFGPHLWPFGSYMDFHHFYYELQCVRPSGCDRANYNATDANGFVFILNDDSPSQVSFSNTSSPLMQGQWVRGTQGVSWISADQGSGIRFERVRIDGADRHVIDLQAEGKCNATASQTNGEFARTYQPCPTDGPWGRQFSFDSASLADGAYNLSVCTQDYGQYRGLNGTGGESCVARTVYVDNTAPGAPVGLHVTSANPARYLDRFGAQYSLPSYSGSPIAKVNYVITDATGEEVMPRQVISGTNQIQIADIAGPTQAGDYRLRVWLEDAVGLVGPAASAPIPHDTTPPAAPQDVSVTAPRIARSAQGFDVRWHNIIDSGSPISTAHYRVINGSGNPVVPARDIEADNPQAIESLDTSRDRGSYTLELWLSDAEGNVGAPVKAPLAHDCVRSDAGGGLSLSAGLGQKGEPTVIVPQEQGSLLAGTLTGAGGQIAGASVCVFSNVVTDGERDFLGVAMTDRDGDYKFVIGPGPSRDITAVYRPDQREIAARATIQTQVRPTFKLHKKTVHNHSFAVFSGDIPGPHNDKVVVVLQVKSGKGWRAFRRYRTREGGRFVMRYLFTQTRTPTTYVMRAQVRETTGYPYLQGNSRALPLRVLPSTSRARRAHSARPGSQARPAWR